MPGTLKRMMALTGVLVFGITVIVFLIILWEGPRLWQARDWRGLAVFSVLLALGAGLSYLWALGLPLPNPTPLIQEVFGWPWFGR